MSDQFVAAGTSAATIQGYINSAVRGDTITFEAGATFNLVSGLSLPVKSGTNDGTDAHSVILRSSALVSLPEGTRVSPLQSAFMAKIVTTDTAPVFTLANGAGGYKILGLELTNFKASPPDNFVVNLMVDATLLGAYLTIDRCLLHSQECPNDTPPYHTTGRFAIAVNGDNVFITNNYSYCFYGIPYGFGAGATARDDISVAISSGGPMLIDNNYFENWYQMIFPGGADTAATSSATISASPTPTLTGCRLSNTTGLVAGMPIAIPLTFGVNHCERDNTHPCWGNGIVQTVNSGTGDITYSALIGTDAGKASGRITIPNGTTIDTSTQAAWLGAVVHDLTVTRNHFHHPTEFAQWVQTYNGNHPKGYMEIKDAEVLLVEGNLMEGYFSTIAIVPVNQSGGSPWQQASDVTIRNNFVQQFSAATFISLTDGYYYNTNGNNITVHNNLFTVPDSAGVTGNLPVLVQSGKGGDVVTITHNTVFVNDSYTANWATWDSSTAGTGALYPAHVTFENNLLGNGNYGGIVRTSVWPGSIENKNIFVLNVNPPNQNAVTEQGFSNSTNQNNYPAVQFVNQGGSSPLDWALQITSPGYHAGTDGTDIGANVTAIINAMSPSDVSVARIQVSGQVSISGNVVLT
jgi:hypothetical protein